MGVVKAEVARMNQSRRKFKPILLTARQRQVGGGIQRRPARTLGKQLGMGRRRAWR